MNTRFLAVVLLLTTILGSPSRAQNVDASAGPLQVGFAAVEVILPTGVPLAGFGVKDRRIVPFDLFDDADYARYFRPSGGIREPADIKVMVMERDSDFLVFVRLELLFLTANLREAIMARLAEIGIEEDSVVIFATHTPNGPGTLIDNDLWALLATDAYDATVLVSFVDGVTQAVLDALDDLSAASLVTWSVAVPDIQRNRNDGDLPVDDRARVLLAQTANGSWRGGLLHFAVQPQTYDSKSLQLSGELGAALESSLEDRLGDGTTVLFVNGAMADIWLRRRARPDEHAVRVADNVMAGRDSARPVAPDWSVVPAEVSLGPAAFRFKPCAESWFWRSVSWPSAGLPLESWLSEAAPIALIRLGDIALFAWPGVPTAALGSVLVDLADMAGARDAWVIALANDYRHYFTTPEEYRVGGVEACRSFYGAEAGVIFIAAYRKLLGLE